MRNIRVTNEVYERFKQIREKRPQDDNNGQTFEHILKFYEGKSVLPLQNMDKNNSFMQLPEKKL